MTLTGGTYKLTLKNPQIGFWLCLYSTEHSPGTVSPQLRRVHTVGVSTRLWSNIIEATYFCDSFPSINRTFPC